jgi:hypothetical protein
MHGVGEHGGALVDLVRGRAIGLNFGCTTPLDGGQPMRLGVPALLVRERLEGHGCFADRSGDSRSRQSARVAGSSRAYGRAT